MRITLAREELRMRIPFHRLPQICRGRRRGRGRERGVEEEEQETAAAITQSVCVCVCVCVSVSLLKDKTILKILLKS